MTSVLKILKTFLATISSFLNIQFSLRLLGALVQRSFNTFLFSKCF